MKTGLNDIDIKIEVTTSLKSNGFSICFLKILEHFHFLLRSYGLKNHTGSNLFLHDVINVMQVCFDVIVITFASTSFWSMLGKIARTKNEFAHV